MLDLLITGGLVVDGSGSPGFYAAIGVEGDRLNVIRGDVSSLEASRTIDASGQVVCPGFIDFHAHSGLVILAEPRHEPKVRQGITTEVIGVDGNSYAPFRNERDLKMFIELNSGLDGAPPLPGLWSSVPEYLSMFDNKVAVNIVYLIGNAPLRINAMGWDNKPASADDLANMKALLREAMEDGAFGMSTGLDYPPGSYADTAELSELGGEAAKLGGFYHTHVRYSLGDRFLDPFREAVEIGRRGQVPVHLTHLFHRLPYRGSGRHMLEFVDEARNEGLDLTFDCFPYPYAGTRLLIIIPQWAQDGGPEKLKEVFRSEEGRERLRREVQPRGNTWDGMWLTYFDKPHNRQYEGKTIAEIADMRNAHPVDAVMDLLLEEDLRISYTGAVVNAATLPSFIDHPLYMVGSDALLLGETPSPMMYGTFPYILADYVREERRFSMQEGIRKMTSFPAQRLGIPDRGMLRDEMKADIVVFEPGAVTAPSSMADAKQYPRGINHVIVNGQSVVQDSVHTGATPGRALRRR